MYGDEIRIEEGMYTRNTRVGRLGIDRVGNHIRFPIDEDETLGESELLATQKFIVYGLWHNRRRFGNS